jgi:hypothetical protein
MPLRLRWPTQFPGIIQEFGVNRTGVPNFYTQFGLPAHEGLDFVAPTGSEIYACADGIVKEVGKGFLPDGKMHPYGILIRLTHVLPEGEYETIYAHLLRPRPDLRAGMPVKAGELVGIADNTGHSKGDHLHLTLKKKGATQRGETKFTMANGQVVTYPRDILNPSLFLDPFMAAGSTPNPQINNTIQSGGTTPAPKPVDKLVFVSDVTIPDESVLPAAGPFKKTWQVRNNGTTDWVNFKLAFLGNTPMTQVGEVNLPDAKPGDEVLVSVELIAPTIPGRYKTTYRAKNGAGEFFGTELFALIRVVK